MKLVIGNKNYSSWSLRAWLAVKGTGASFEEVRIPLQQDTTDAEIAKFSAAGKVPILLDGDIKVWESLAICEYLAERFPASHLWPADPKARALARSVSNEMHAGFQGLRQNMPMDIRSSCPGEGLTPGVKEDIERIQAIWNECRARYGKKGGLLFGDFSIADAMFVPVVFRFRTYGVKLDPVSQSYSDSVLALPAVREWQAAALLEKETI